MSTRPANQPYPVEIHRDHEPSWWLQREVSALLAGIADRAATFCPHLDSGMCAFGVTALWKPGRVVCQACAPELNLSGRGDKLCDRCGTHDGEGVHPAMIQPMAGLFVLLGLCDGCHAKELGR